MLCAFRCLLRGRGLSGHSGRNAALQGRELGGDGVAGGGETFPPRGRSWLVHVTHGRLAAGLTGELAFEGLELALLVLGLDIDGTRGRKVDALGPAAGRAGGGPSSPVTALRMATKG